MYAKPKAMGVGIEILYENNPVNKYLMTSGYFFRTRQNCERSINRSKLKDLKILLKKRILSIKDKINCCYNKTMLTICGAPP